MSDVIVVTALLCITTLGLTAIMAISTYNKDKIDFKVKTKIKDIASNELVVTGQDIKEEKNKNIL